MILVFGAEMLRAANCAACKRTDVSVHLPTGDLFPCGPNKSVGVMVFV